MTDPLLREISPQIRRALQTLPAVVVTGLRQAGKTTLLQTDPALAGRRYLTLDDFATLEGARSAPEALIGGAEPVTIDEVQRCPELLIAIKRAIDRDRAPGRFLLSGSANLALMAGVSESLAGRALYLTLHPFTRRERLGATDEEPFLVRFLARQELPPGQAKAVEPVAWAEVLLGGLPPVALGQTPHPELWFRGYVQTYLERDLRNLSQVADLVGFRNLAQLTALRTGQVLNQSELGRDARMPATTVGRYLGLLETTFLLERLPPYLRSPTTRLIKSPKVFLSDSGLAAHLAAVTDLGPTTDEPMRGALLETFVAQNLRGILSSHLPDAELFFWSVQGRHEVDFVIATRGKRLAIEVKAASRWSEGDLRSLRAFLEGHPEATAAVLAYNGSQAVGLGDRLFAIPLSWLLS